MFTSETKVRVRYGETDKMGYLYYGFYALYYEVGRVEMLRDVGLSYRMMEDELHVAMPVMNMHCQYLRPAYYDDLLTVKTRVEKFPERDIVFYSDIYNEKDKLINSGSVKLAFIDMKTGRRLNCPEVILEKMRPFFD